MAEIGTWARLKVLRDRSPGFFLDAGELGEILLPGREAPEGTVPGDEIDVFLYHDSEDCPVATTSAPKAVVGEFAYLEVVALTPVGAFLNWGLPKDLLVPFREQKTKVPIEVGRSYVVRIARDEETGRIIASTRLARYLNLEPAAYRPGDEVDLMIYGLTDLGTKAIVNGRHTGLLFASDTFRRLFVGERTRGYVVQVREGDGKIDLSLYPPGRDRIEALAEEIIFELETHRGFLGLHDKSPPERISATFGVSKKAFKQATGQLFRQRRITLEADGIRLVEPQGG
jgi:predicted RNA-binding protein (virulence factor B family)